MTNPKSSIEFFEALQKLDERFTSMQPEMELTVRDPALDLEGYVVVWTTLTSIGNPLGRVGKGGTRITKMTSLEEIKMLAKIMALKNAASGLPLGGAKSGICADSSAPDFEKKFRRFVALTKPTLIENGGIFGGYGFDIGARTELPIWACDEAKSTRCFTGKPVEMGGTDYDREGIAGLGVAVAARTALSVRGEDIRKTQVAIQGLGAMGAGIFRYLREYGGNVKYVADPRFGGTFELPEKLPDSLAKSICEMRFEDSKRQLETLGGKASPLEDVLFSDVDILFPAATQNVLTPANVSRVHARCVVEGANSPTTKEAQEMLRKNGVLVLPDFLVNAGGIIAAYVEMSATISAEENARTRKNVSDAKKLTEERIEANVRRVLGMQKELGVEDTVALSRYIALSNIFQRQ